MLISNELYKMTSFIMSILFSASVIFLCSFGLVYLFDGISKYDLTTVSSMDDVDSIAATITGISINEDAMLDSLYTSVEHTINGVMRNDSYSLAQAKSDASGLLSTVISSDMSVSILTQVSHVLNDISIAIDDVIDAG